MKRRRKVRVAQKPDILQEILEEVKGMALRHVQQILVPAYKTPNKPPDTPEIKDVEFVVHKERP